MRVEIVTGDLIDPADRQALRDLASRGLLAEGGAALARLSIAVIGREEMAELNQRFRGKAGATDVLAFPLSDRPQARDHGGRRGSGTTGAAVDEPAEDVLGEIVICADIAREQAVDLGHSFRHELSFLLIHGLLHLFGYRHDTDREAELMDARTDELVAADRSSRKEGA